MRQLLILLVIFTSSLNIAFTDSIEIKNYLLCENIQQVYHDQNGYLWVATSNNGLYRYDGRNLNEFNLPSRTSIHNFFETNKGELLLVSSTGVFELKEHEIEAYGQAKIFRQSSNDIIQSNDGSLILASDNGIWNVNEETTSEIVIGQSSIIREIDKIHDQFFAISDNHLVQFDSKLNSIKHSSSDTLSDLCIFQASKVLLARGKAGIGILDEGVIKSFNIEGTPDYFNVIYLEDFEDYLLIGTRNNGLWIWDEKDYKLEKYFVSNGLASGTINIVEVDHWGNIWVGTKNGLQRIRLDKMNRENPPIVKIRQIQTYPGKDDNQMIQLPIQFRADNNFLNIRYSAIDLSSDNEIEIQWRLNEKDNWSIPSQTNEISLSKLKAGNYNFQLKASSDQKYYGYSEKIPIQSTLAFYKSFWFYGFLGLGMLALSWIISWVRYRNLEQVYQSSREKWQIEKRLFEVEQKALQQQMNPHFIFNALQSIKGLVSINQNRSARKYLNSFAQMLRSVLKQSRDGSISMEDEIQYLKDYLKLEQLNRNQNFQFSIDSNDMDLDIKIPSMIIQPFVENAILHGLKNRPGEIKICFEDKQDWLEVTVNDNGIGMAEPAKKKGSFGTQIVQDRLRHFSSTKRKYSFTYSPLNESNGMQSGTSVKIQIPILA